jgi:hypothetical protein
VKCKRKWWVGNKTEWGNESRIQNYLEATLPKIFCLEVRRKHRTETDFREIVCEDGK